MATMTCEQGFSWLSAGEHCQNLERHIASDEGPRRWVEYRYLHCNDDLQAVQRAVRWVVLSCLGSGGYRVGGARLHCNDDLWGVHVQALISAVSTLIPLHSGKEVSYLEAI